MTMQHGDNEAVKSGPVQTINVVDQPQQGSSYSVLTEKSKIFFIIISSLFNFLGLVTANIYYPALGALSRDLNTSSGMINLTITSYMVI